MRGGVVESEHRVAWCVVEDGAVAAEAWPGAAELVNSRGDVVGRLEVVA